MKTIDEVIKNKLDGLYYGNRLIVPFHANFLKVIVEDEIITDFSPSAKGINIIEEENFTNLYFLDYKQLKNFVSEFETIKILAVEKEENIFDANNHKKIVVYLKEKHKAVIELADKDILFID